MYVCHTILMVFIIVFQEPVVEPLEPFSYIHPVLLMFTK